MRNIKSAIDQIVLEELETKRRSYAITFYAQLSELIANLPDGFVEKLEISVLFLKILFKIVKDYILEFFVKNVIIVLMLILYLE